MIVKLYKMFQIHYVLIVLICLLSITRQGASQEGQPPDSLTQKLKDAVNEIDKVDAYEDIADYYLRRNPVKASDYAQKADSIIRKNDLAGRRPAALRLIGNSLHYRREYSKAKEYYRKSINIADSLGNEREVNISREDMAIIATDQGDFEEAHRKWEKILDFYNTTGDSSGLADVRLNRGMTYYEEQNFPRALSSFQKALSYYRNTDDREAIAGLYNNIGMVHKSNQDNNKARAYYEKALDGWKQMGDMRGIAMTSNNLGIIYSELGNNKKALEYFRKSLNIAGKTGNTRGISNNERNIGIVYHKMGEPDSALVHLKKALDLARKAGQKQNMIPIYDEMAVAYHTKGLNSKALEAANNALELNKKLKLPEARRDANEVLYKVYDERGNAEQALKHYKKFVAARDSIRSKENYREIVQMEYQYNLEQQRQKHRLEQEKQQAELEKQKLIRNLSIGGFILLLMAGLLGFRFYRIKQKSNEALESKNKEIEKQRRKLAEQAENLKNSNEKLKELDRFKEGMTSMLVHDLKNPLNTVLLASNRGIAQDNGNQEELKKIERSGKHMLRMVENILDVYRYEDSNMDLNLQNINLTHSINDTIERNYYLAEPKNISLINRVARDRYVNADVEVLNRILDNLLTNAIKYTPNNGEVIFNTSKSPEGDYLQVSVTDNGEGIPGDKHDKIFERFEQVSKRKSGSSFSTGLGLTFCKLAVEAHGGSINVDSTLGEGTTISFSLPQATDVDEDNDDLQSSNSSSPFPDTIKLTKDEVNSIEDKLRQLQSLEIYEVSSVRSILHSIDNTGYSVNVNKWKNHVLNAVMVGNEMRYKNLINLDKQNESYE